MVVLVDIEVHVVMVVVLRGLGGLVVVVCVILVERGTPYSYNVQTVVVDVEPDVVSVVVLQLLLMLVVVTAIVVKWLEQVEKAIP